MGISVVPGSTKSAAMGSGVFRMGAARRSRVRTTVVVHFRCGGFFCQLACEHDLGFIRGNGEDGAFHAAFLERLGELGIDNLIIGLAMRHVEPERLLLAVGGESGAQVDLFKDPLDLGCLKGNLERGAGGAAVADVDVDACGFFRRVFAADGDQSQRVKTWLLEGDIAFLAGRRIGAELQGPVLAERPDAQISVLDLRCDFEGSRRGDVRFERIDLERFDGRGAGGVWIEVKCDSAVVFVAQEIAETQLDVVSAGTAIGVRERLLGRGKRFERRAVAEIPPAIAGAGGPVLLGDGQSLSMLAEVRQRLARLDGGGDQGRDIHEDRPGAEAHDACNAGLDPAANPAGGFVVGHDDPP